MTSQQKKKHLLQVSSLLMLLKETSVLMSLILLKHHYSKLLTTEQYKKHRLKWQLKNWGDLQETAQLSKEKSRWISIMFLYAWGHRDECAWDPIVCAVISHTKNKIVLSDMLIEVPLESVRITCQRLRAEFGPKSLVRTLCWNPTENRGFERTVRIKLM